MAILRQNVLALASLVGLVATMTPAAADQGLNCDAYAKKAVSQEKQNKTLGCGFTSQPGGAGWSTDYNAHFAWCRLPSVNMENLTRDDRARDSALQSCRQEKEAAGKKLQTTPMQPLQPQTPAAEQQDQMLDVLCGRYAMDARSQNQENRSFNCGFAGGRWSDDVNGHRAWCMRAGIAAADNETRIRNDMLNTCKGGGKCTAQSDCGPFLCNVETGACFSSCVTTQEHCAPDFVCDDGACRHKCNYAHTEAEKKRLGCK